MYPLCKDAVNMIDHLEQKALVEFILAMSFVKWNWNLKIKYSGGIVIQMLLWFSMTFQKNKNHFDSVH